MAMNGIDISNHQAGIRLADVPLIRDLQGDGRDRICRSVL